MSPDIVVTNILSGIDRAILETKDEVKQLAGKIDGLRKARQIVLGIGKAPAEDVVEVPNAKTATSSADACPHTRVHWPSDRTVRANCQDCGHVF